MASAVLVFHRLDIGAWFDETFSYGVSTQPFDDYVTKWLWGSEENMALYYLIMRGWLGLLSLAHVAPVEVLLRLPSAVLAAAATVMVYVLGRYLFERAVGLVAAGVFASNLLFMTVAQFARAYTLEMFLLVLSWWAMFKALEHGGLRWWLAYTATMVLAVYSDLFAGLVLVAEVIALVALAMVDGPWRARVRSRLRPISLSFGGAFACVLPLVVDSAVHGPPRWVPPAGLNQIRVVVDTVGGNSHVYEVAIVIASAAGLAGVAWSLRWRGLRLGFGSRRHIGPALAVGAWFAVPILISFALTQRTLNVHLFYPRYLVVVIAPMALLVGLGVAAIREWRLQAVAAAAVALVAFPPLVQYYAHSEIQNFQDSAVWIQERAQPGDGIVCYGSAECAIPMEYYLAAYPSAAGFDARSPGYFRWNLAASNPVTQTSVRTFERDHARIFLIYLHFNPPAADDAAAVGGLEQVLTADGYRLVGQKDASAGGRYVTVLLFSKT